MSINYDFGTFILLSILLSSILVHKSCGKTNKHVTKLPGKNNKEDKKIQVEAQILHYENDFLVAEEKFDPLFSIKTHKKNIVRKGLKIKHYPAKSTAKILSKPSKETPFSSPPPSLIIALISSSESENPAKFM